jgi:hypothetical protein
MNERWLKDTGQSFKIQSKSESENPMLAPNVDNRLGALLTRLGLVSQDEVSMALDAGVERRLPIGKMFILQERLSAQVLRLVVDAQWMLKDRMLKEEEAFEAVDVAHRNSWSLNDALVTIGVEANPTKGSRLGELLVNANVLSEASVRESLNMTAAIELPLGRILIIRGVLSDGIVWNAVNLQRSMRKGEITLDHAVSLLKLVRDDLQCSNFRLGELLIASRQLEKEKIEEALAEAARVEKAAEEVLIDAGYIDRDTLNRTIEVHRLLRLNRVDYPSALQLLQNDTSIDRLEELRKAASADGTDLSLYEFLRLSGYFAKGKLSSFVGKMAEDKAFMLELLASKNIPAERSVRKSVEEIIGNSDLLATALTTLYPSDRELISLAEKIVQSVNASSMTVESGLLDIADHMQLFNI